MMFHVAYPEILRVLGRFSFRAAIVLISDLHVFQQDTARERIKNSGQEVIGSSTTTLLQVDIFSIFSLSNRIALTNCRRSFGQN